ncbi:hypothetical protein O6H91_14G002300 [Diphasiastrum complanatum]|uniref:Uncharacterized protein n=1 Tax=Diphasiastrum complanatum TaxID=34168 RepID=A0ACC2BKV0_DIPCM|nr:hypothetical protein O6H91_14G002300 [Diphasiastrum complanatum]
MLASAFSSLVMTPSLYRNTNRGEFDRSLTPEARVHDSRFSEVENVLAQSLRTENDLLQCQLNDLITRDKNQRLEIQKLRQHCDAEVATRVQSGTSKLKAEVEQLKSMLHSTSSQLLQALGEREHARNEQEEVLNFLEHAEQSTASQKNQMAEHIRFLEDTLTKNVGLLKTMANSVEAFQHHVLPTFKLSGFEDEKLSSKEVLSSEAEEGTKLMEQLTRLEKGLTLLRVIVDAKNDTLVLIRGKLKQENEELKAELQTAHETKHVTEKPMQIADEDGFEKHKLQQELQTLQSHFRAEVNDLKAKLKTYETEEQQGEGRLLEVQKEFAALLEKLNIVEASRSLLESRLKEETSERSHLILELLNLRKFLVRQTRSGRIPAEKMDLMNTVNHLLGEVNKINTEKITLNEKLKVNQRLQLYGCIKQGVTDRDIELAASNKVGDSELASKLARERLQQFQVVDSAKS